MNIHKLFFLKTLFFIILMINFQPVSAHKTISTNKPLLPYVSFNPSNISFDGKQNEFGFGNVTLTTQTDSVVIVYWRQNGNELHVVLTVDKYAWIGIGWSTNISKYSSDLSMIDGVNFIIATNTSVGEYSGTSTGFIKASSSDLINSSVYTDLYGIYMEFTIPLNSTLSSTSNLVPKTFSNFIFVIGDSYVVGKKPLETGNLILLPNVYIESSSREGYSISTTPFAFSMILMAIFLFNLIMCSLAVIILVFDKKAKI